VPEWILRYSVALGGIVMTVMLLVLAFDGIVPHDLLVYAGMVQTREDRHQVSGLVVGLAVGLIVERAAKLSPRSAHG